jgi:adenine phosphoribosyltransferase
MAVDAVVENGRLVNELDGSIRLGSVQALFSDFHATVDDFPIVGIKFKDIAPFLARKGVVRSCALAAETLLRPHAIDKVLAVDARGFILGAALCAHIDAGFVMVRKPGKLPGAVDRFDYTCEYSSGTLEVTRGAITPGDRCLILDDVLATGGTARATSDFVASEGGTVTAYAFMVEIKALQGRSRLQDAPVVSLIEC